MKPEDLNKEIKNIVFDLGGVVITLNRNRAVRSLIDLGVRDADKLLGLYRQEEPFLGLETGRITAAQFYDLLRRQCEPATDVEIQEAFNSFLIEIPAARLEMLRKLRSAGYRLYVLSNTNPVMYNSWIARAFRAEGLTINDYFDGIVTSFAEGMCKPDVRLFRTVLDRYRLKGEETLMLDDSEANCNAAALAGMNAIRVGGSADDDMLALGGQLLKIRD